MQLTVTTMGHCRPLCVVKRATETPAAIVDGGVSVARLVFMDTFSTPDFTYGLGYYNRTF